MTQRPEKGDTSLMPTPTEPETPPACCGACGKEDCRTPVPEAEVERRVLGQHDRLCEEDDCHVIAPQPGMVRLFGQEWYCPGHAYLQLKHAGAERSLSAEEQELFLGMAQNPPAMPPPWKPSMTAPLFPEVFPFGVEGPDGVFLAVTDSEAHAHLLAAAPFLAEWHNANNDDLIRAFELLDRLNDAPGAALLEHLTDALARIQHRTIAAMHLTEPPPPLIHGGKP